MNYRTCPICGRAMILCSTYSHNQVPKRIFKCSCGFRTDVDMSGLSYSDFLNRYHFGDRSNNNKPINY